MEVSIFKKMKVKSGMTAALLYVPPEYPDYDGFSDFKEDKDDFVHLFVTSKEEFSERFGDAEGSVCDESLFWLSYPKLSRTEKYDINRDVLWDLVILYGGHPVAQVSLDEKWSAVRLKRNESGVHYERPNRAKSRD